MCGADAEQQDGGLDHLDLENRVPILDEKAHGGKHIVIDVMTEGVGLIGSCVD